MSFQWTVIAGFLYCEIAVTIILLLPILSPTRWQWVFSCRPVRTCAVYANYTFTIFLVLLGICFIDSIRVMSKYSEPDRMNTAESHSPRAAEHMHMKLFRAQRNFYIAGFSLFLWFVIRRLVILISTEANLEKSLSKAIKDVKAASEEVSRLSGELDNSTVENKSVQEAANQLNDLKEALRVRELDMDALKKQTEATNAEYDRLSENYQELQKKFEALTSSSSGDKKTT